MKTHVFSGIEIISENDKPVGWRLIDEGELVATEIKRPHYPSAIRSGKEAFFNYFLFEEKEGIVPLYRQPNM